MKREVVQDFLNLPGIAGLALMDGRSRPYFCGVDRSLNFQQKEALAQGIQQVIDTTPSDFEFFEFQFSGHQVYIYKLECGIILLVLTAANLALPTYVETVERLKSELQRDVINAIATFRLLAGNTTLSGQNYWKPGIETGSTASIPSQSGIPNHPLTTEHPNSSNGSSHPPSQTQPTPSASPVPRATSPSPEIPSPKPDHLATSKEVLVAINHLSQFTTQYLGPTVVTNYWKTTRPDVEWLSQFQVERTAQLSLPETVALLPLSDEQHQWVQAWVAAFIDRCAKVIRDYPKTVRQTALNDRQKFLLLAE
ncbi:MAG: hypothetical protein HC769_14875 [Cyanobacteria bacterium CRU_2_1]|nr:hypothetical protein [Cyanobacteria bacterium RU_5_0]NJR60004.1 hypothetical protein [Cyanobacteria bacterium CRU_2_1]